MFGSAQRLPLAHRLLSAAFKGPCRVKDQAWLGEEAASLISSNSSDAKCDRLIWPCFTVLLLGIPRAIPCVGLLISTKCEAQDINRILGDEKV